jgi:glycosyltransferase involved in cell wall biosynthesis
MVYYGQFGSSPLTVWLKYLLQAMATFRLIRRERAELVLVMTPPVFAGATVMLFSMVRPLRYIIDVHTAALLMPRWRRWQWLQGLVCRRAVTTFVTNDTLAAIVSRRGGHTTIVRDVPVEYPSGDAFSKLDRFTVAVICSFNYDEPLDEMFCAAARVPDVQFIVTGDHKVLPAARKAACPANITLSGFLTNADYGSLLRNADAVMSLTTRDHTMLRGAYEAIYSGTPVIVSSWPLLRDAFNLGAVHVDASADDIVRGIALMRNEHVRFRREAGELRRQKLEVWNATRGRVLQQLQSGS